MQTGLSTTGLDREGMVWSMSRRVCRISRNYLPRTLLYDIIFSRQGDWLKGCGLMGPTSV